MSLGKRMTDRVGAQTRIAKKQTKAEEAKNKTTPSKKQKTPKNKKKTNTSLLSLLSYFHPTVRVGGYTNFTDK